MFLVDETKQSKGVQQSVRCHFRKEDFVKQTQRAETALEASNERFVEGINTKDGETQQAVGMPALHTSMQIE